MICIKYWICVCISIFVHRILYILLFSWTIVIFSLCLLSSNSNLHVSFNSCAVCEVIIRGCCWWVWLLVYCSVHFHVVVSWKRWPELHWNVDNKNIAVFDLAPLQDPWAPLNHFLWLYIYSQSSSTGIDMNHINMPQDLLHEIDPKCALVCCSVYSTKKGGKNIHIGEKLFIGLVIF